MYRRGIIARKDIPQDLSATAPDPPSLAFTLLAELDTPLSTAEEAALELIAEAMATGHGLVHRRRTFPGRYAPVNAAIVQAVTQSLPGAAPLRVHDVGVSNGISAAEFFRTLAAASDPQFVGMDYLDAITVVGPIGQWRVVFDNVGRPLQFVGHSLVIPVVTRDRARYVFNRLLRAWLKRTVMPRAQRMLRTMSGPDQLVRTISAFHPRARDLVATDPRFRLEFGDMYEPARGPFDVIRVMSVFSNLDANQIARAVRSICTPLVDGGLLAIGRNPGRHTREIPTTIFRRQGRRLVPLHDLMGGAEQRAVILAVELPHPGESRPA